MVTKYNQTLIYLPQVSELNATDYIIYFAAYFLRLKKKSFMFLEMCITLFVWDCTVVFALDKVLPFSKPLHADTQDDCRRFFSLKLLI